MFPTQQPEIIKANPLPEMPADLLCKVMSRIHNERQIAAAKRRLIIWAVCLSLSLVAFVPALYILRVGSAASGFAQYFSLIFSDTAIILAAWESFALSLLETLPVTGLIAFLAVLLLALYTARRLAREWGKIIMVSPSAGQIGNHIFIKF